MTKKVKKMLSDLTGSIDDFAEYPIPHILHTFGQTPHEQMNIIKEQIKNKVSFQKENETLSCQLPQGTHFGIPELHLKIEGKTHLLYVRKLTLGGQWKDNWITKIVC